LLRVSAGANVSASAPPDERPTTYRIFKDGVELSPHELPVQVAAATGAEIRDYEFDLVQHDDTRTFLGNASPLLGPDGRPAGAVGAFLDVTAWKQAEAQVRLFARVVETTSDFIGICTPDMKPIFLNEAGRRMVGLESMEDVRRTVLMDYFWPEDRARIESEAIPTLVREGRWSGEIRFRHFKTGEPIPTMWNAFVIRDDTGASTAWATVSPDLTALKKAEQELRDANTQLTEADRRKSEFLAVLSHELRNPLAPIRNSIYMLDRAPAGSPQAARGREVIRRQTEHLTRLVDDLLDMTRIARGKIELHREILDLREIVRRTHDDHQFLFERRDVEVRLEGRPSPVWVDGDPTRLAQVVGNLLQNAAKFAQEGGSTRITAAEANNRAEVRVRDDGVGIEPDQLRRVFEPFAQADSGSGRRRGGLGLGLALAKGLVELHGGTLTARSEGLGRGSEFIISLPLATPPPPADMVVRPERAAGPRSIIIIEDNADAASTLADALALGGHSIHVALDGRSGIELARSVNPDIVICDIGLPDVDGYEVARTLRADQELRSTRLVALSGYAQPQDKERAKEAGFDSHLSKPSSLDELNEVVASSSRRP
jgi:PAS domain S-box-containing protein